MCSFSGATYTSRVRHNADYVPYAKTALIYRRGFSRDVTRSRVCIVTLLIRHFGGQAPAVVCAVCAVHCAIDTS